MLKRTLDFTLAAILLAAMSPVLLLVSLVVIIKFRRPILFSQARPGLHEKIFRIYKFRTMHDTRDRHGHLLPDAMRISTLGQFLRSTSLDELPALWNVVKGDMRGTCKTGHAWVFDRQTRQDGRAVGAHFWHDIGSKDNIKTPT